MKPEFSALAEREPVTIEKRRVLTRVEVIELAVRQGGKCGCKCGGKLDAMREGVTDEHVIALALGGSNDLDNRELWRKPCSDAKTAGKDLPAIAKAKRLAGETGKAKRLTDETCTGPTRQIPTRVRAWPPKGSRKLSSRPLARSE